VNLALAATVFGIIFIGELPDKTMFASLLLAARGKAGSVWIGAAAAFLVHVAIAVTVGGVLLTLLPHRWVQAVVALVFLIGAVLAFRDAGEDGEDAADGEAGPEARKSGSQRMIRTAFVVIFLAEWGDLTQILTANLAARYGQPLLIGIAATAALWAVGGLAVGAGRLLRNLPAALVRRITGFALLALGVVTAIEAITGANWFI
jgi:putative Ca2+/H+ antiporter (TMEM165/GDT1 family)